MDLQHSPATASFLNTTVTAIIVTVIFFFFTVQFSQTAHQSHIKNLDQSFIQRNKSLVKNEVHRTAQKIIGHEKRVFENLREKLREKVEYAHLLLLSNYKNSRSLETVITDSREKLELFKWDTESAYFYIFDLQGKVLYHGGDTSYEKQNIFEQIQGNPELESFIQDAMEKDENFGNYKWKKPRAKNDNLFKKYVYSKKIKELGIYIAAGVYKDEVQARVRKEMIKNLENKRFGENDYGYFWIHDTDNNILMQPVQRDLVGKNLTDFKSLDGQFLFRNISQLLTKKQSGFISYRWYRPDGKTEDEKTSYVYLVEDMDIIIGAGFYLGELKALLDDERKKLNAELHETLIKLFLVTGLIIFFSMLIARLVAKKIHAIEDTRNQYFSMLEQYKLILDKSSIVSKADPQGIITYVNDSFCSTCGYSKAEVLGHPYSILTHPETPKSQHRELWQTILQGNIWKGVLKNRAKNGTTYYQITTIAPIKDDEGNILEFISAGSDITELVENRNKLESIFITDTLTGLGNRVSLIKHITENPGGTLALININSFKEINDSHGHEVGDQVIKDLGARLFDTLPGDCYTLYRVEGDVFAIYTSKEKNGDVIHRIESFMEDEGGRNYHIDHNDLVLTYTAGLSNDYNAPLACADMALHEAKASQASIRCFDASMNSIDVYKSNLQWVKKIREALSEDRIVPYFQPIYCYQTQRVKKYECLMRLLDHKGNASSPTDFLPIAKKTKLYPLLTQKMILKSFDYFSILDLEFSINLTAEDLMNPKLMSFMFDYARKHNLLDRLVIEIVETEEIEDSDTVLKVLQRLKAEGSKIAIDDFGSGYSNYDYLRTLQADYIKIDANITKHLLSDVRTEKLVKSIVNFAKSSNMQTIAEHVFSQELDEAVKSLGVDYAQGYYYGKPEPSILEHPFDEQLEAAP